MNTSDTSWQPVAEHIVKELVNDVNALNGLQLNSQDVQVRLRILPFYAFLNIYEIETSSDVTIPIQRTYVLWTPGIVLLLPENDADKHIQALNKEMLPIGGFRLSSDNLLEYLRFYFGHVQQGSKKYQVLDKELELESEPDTPQAQKFSYRPRQWKIETITNSVHLFKIQIFILSEGNVYNADISLTEEGSIEFFLNSAGDIRPIIFRREHEFCTPLLLTSLPDNRELRTIQLREKLETIATNMQQRYEAESQTFAWKKTDVMAHNALLRIVDEMCKPNLPAVGISSRVMELPFYRLVDLYELQIIELNHDGTFSVSDDQRIYVLWTKPEYAMLPDYQYLLQLLDWTNGPIYAFNEESDKLDFLNIDKATVPAYLKFFFGLVKGRHGFFHWLPAGSIKLRQESPEKEEILLSVPELQAEQPVDDLYRAEAIVLFKESIFKTWGNVRSNGHVFLSEETLLGEMIPPAVPTIEMRAGTIPNTATKNLALTFHVGQVQKRRRAMLKIKLDELQRIAVNKVYDTEWQEWDAKTFLSKLKQAHNAEIPYNEAINITKKIIKGPVFINDEHYLSGRIALIDCYFDHPIILDTTRSNLVFSAERCFFRGGLTFGSHWDGNISLKLSKLYEAQVLHLSSDSEDENIPPSQFLPAPHPLLTLSNLSHAGDIRLELVWIQDKLEFGQLHCTLVNISDSWLEGELNLKQAKCDSISILRSWTETDKQVILEQIQCGKIEIRDNWLNDRIDLEDSQCNSVNIYRNRIEKDIWSSGLRCASVSITGNDLRGTLLLNGLGCEIISITKNALNAQLDLRSATVQRIVIVDNLLRGDLLCSEVNCNTVTLKDNISHNAFSTELDLSRANIQRLSLAINGLSGVALNDTIVHGVAEITGASRGYITGNNMRCGPLLISGDEDPTTLLEVLNLTYLRAERVELQSIQITGDCLLEKANIEFGLLIYNTEVGKKLGLSGLSVGGRVRFGALIVGGNCDLSNAIIEREIVIGSWYASRKDSSVLIKGHLLLDEVRTGHLNISPCVIEGFLSANNAHFASFDFWSGLTKRDGEQMEFVRSRVGRWVQMDGAVIDGDFHWVGIDIAFNTVTTESDYLISIPKSCFSADRLRVDGNFRLSANAEQVQEFIIKEFTSYSGTDGENDYGTARIQAKGLNKIEWEKMGQSKFDGPLDLNSLKAAGDFICFDCSIGGDLSIKYGEISGSLRLHSTDIKGELHLKRCHVHHNFESGPDLSIAGTADLTSLVVGGLLTFDHTTIGKSLILTHAKLNRGLTTKDLTVQESFFLRSVTAHDDINLTGIKLGVVPVSNLRSTRYYQLEAANLTVEGTLLFSPDLENSGQSAHIPGSIDLTRAKLWQLVLFNHTDFACSSTAISTEEEIRLEDAKIGTLTVHHPAPRLLKLRGLLVQEWNLAPKSNLQSNAEAHIYFLNQSEDKDIQRSLYRAVEERFYNDGDNRASNAVYKNLWQRETKEKPAGRRTFRRIVYPPFSYFTDMPPWGSWLFLFGWLLFSTWVFADGSRVMPSDKTKLIDSPISTSATATIPVNASYTSPLVLVPELKPTPYLRLFGSAMPEPSINKQLAASENNNAPTYWSWRSGLWLALHYHLPILPALGRSAWVASDKPVLYGFSPDDYAGIVSLAHWLIMPIFILLISQAVLRRARRSN